MSNEKNLGWLGCIGGVILSSYIGIIINHCKNPYSPTSIMESRRVFFVAQVIRVPTPSGHDGNLKFTLPETNSLPPENRPSQKETHLPTPVFQVLC